MLKLMFALLAIDTQVFVVAPSGELTSLMIGKETTFATAVTPTATHIPDSVDFSASNDTLERPGATKAVGQNDEPVGMFTGKFNVSVEPDPDNLGTWLLLAMGAEAIAANSGNPTQGTGTTTITTGVSAGATTFTLTSATGFATGNGCRLDAGLPTQEDVVITGLAGSVVTCAALKYNHGAAAAVTPCLLAQNHTFSLSSPRLSFTAQLNRILEVINCFGAKVGKFSLSCDPKGIVKCTVSGSYANEASVGSPTSPVYSVINPLIFQATSNTFLINGVAADASIMSWKIDVDTGLVAEYPKFGNGRFPAAYPEQKTVVSLSFDIAYETTTQERYFWGNLAGTGPQSTVPSLPSTSIVCASPDYINANVPYQLGINFGRVKWVKAPIKMAAKSYETQTITAKVYMSARGANDDVKFSLVNASSANSL